MLSMPNPGVVRTDTRPSTSHQSTGRPSSPTTSLETITYHHIQDMAAKRISTLEYLRRVHSGHIFWFNSLLYNKADIQKLPYFDPRKLGRRATNFLLLGLSLPAVLDLNSSSAAEFLKALNALLSEFESFQQIHPPDGSSSSLSRARIPQMLKRATGTGKGRRTSAAAEIGMPMSYEADSSSLASNTSAAISLPTGDVDLLPGEEYLYLATPSLPFDPDFYETFASLCDVLIDCYTRLVGLVSDPSHCHSGIAEMFTKADARVRKIIIHGVIKEFEDTTRSGVKSEIAGVGKVVLGGLM